MIIKLTKMISPEILNNINKIQQKFRRNKKRQNLIKNKI